MTSPFGAGRIEVKPPERGIFPLDHDAECKQFVKEFLECLKKNKNDHFYCRESSKAYLQCRMDRNLMRAEPLANLGFDPEDPTYVRQPNTDIGRKEREGFLGGLGVAGSSKGGFLSWSGKKPPSGGTHG